MLPIKFTSKLVQLPLNKLRIIKTDEIEEKEGILNITIKRRTKHCKCPYCGNKTKKKYDNSEYVQKGVKHYTTFKWNLELNLVKRRFFCRECKKSFHPVFQHYSFPVIELN